MSVLNEEILNQIILKEDLYKDNTLILKKGCMLNSYVINKLTNFGLDKLRIGEKNFNTYFDEITNKKEILILQTNQLSAMRTRSILNHAGYNNQNILILQNSNHIKLKVNFSQISYIFVDYNLFNDSFLNEILLKQTNNRIKIFVLNCENINTEKLKYNTDYQNIKFLHRSLDKNYIKALIRLYS